MTGCAKAGRAIARLAAIRDSFKRDFLRFVIKDLCKNFQNSPFALSSSKGQAEPRRVLASKGKKRNPGLPKYYFP